MGTVLLENVQYAYLSDVDDVAPISDQDHDVLAELRDVLRKHGLTDRFGVCLLHRHFELSEGEVLMESTDVTSRVSLVEVADRNAITGSSIPTMWKFSSDGKITAGTECRQACHYENYGHMQVHIKVGV